MAGRLFTRPSRGRDRSARKPALANIIAGSNATGTSLGIDKREKRNPVGISIRRNRRRWRNVKQDASATNARRPVAVVVEPRRRPAHRRRP